MSLMVSGMPRRGQELPHKQEAPLPTPPHPGLVFGVGAGRASGDRLRYLALRRAAEREVHDARPSPLPPGKVRCRGRQLRTEGDDRQDRLAGVVGQALHQGHRTGVRPVQVLQGDRQPISPRRRKSRSTAPPDGMQATPRPKRAAGRRPPLPAEGRSDPAAMAPARDHRAADVSAAAAARPQSPAGMGRERRQGQPGQLLPTPAGRQPSAPAPASGGTCPLPGLTRNDDAAPAPTALRRGPIPALGSPPAAPPGPGTAPQPRSQFAASAPGPLNDHRAEARWVLPVCPVTHSAA
jgi:hypothetical protein